jgi:hypothetical protein
MCASSRTTRQRFVVHGIHLAPLIRAGFQALGYGIGVRGVAVVRKISKFP